MADLAELGIRVTSDEVTTADQRLDAFTKSASAAETELDQLAAAARGLGAGALVVADQTGQASTALALQQRQANAARMGTQQLGMQINDLGTQISTGINPLVAFNQQLGQIGFAMSQMQGRAGTVGAFLAGPWGAAITIGIAVLGGFATKILQQNDALDEAVKKLRDDAKETEVSSRAKTIYARSAEGVREALRDMNAELEQAITTGRQAELRTLAQVEGHKARILVLREEIKALIQLREQEAKAQLDRAMLPNQQGEVAALGLPAAQRALAEARADLAANTSDLAKAQQAIRNAAVPIAIRTAEELSSATGRINRLYDQMADSAKVAAQGNDQLARSLGGTLLGIERQRQAALDAERERERAEGASGRRDRSAAREIEREYESLMERSQQMRDAMALERQSLGLNETQMMRNAAAAQARKLVSEGATAEAVALANQLLDEAEALEAATAAYERNERVKAGTGSLQDMLTQLERQAELIGASAEAQAVMNAEWAIADLKLKDITPEMQALIDKIKELAQSNEFASRQDPLGDITRDLREIDRIARRAGEGMEEAFGRGGRALSDLLTNMTGYRAEMAAIAEDEAKGHLTREAAARARASAEIGMYGDMISAAKGYFDENSAGYRLLHAIEMAYRAFQFASAIQAMALGGQETSLTVGQNAIKAASHGVVAVARAIASLPFPFNLAAGAATIAALAAIGVKIAGGGGDSGRGAANDNSPERSTEAVRSYSEQQAEARDQATSAIASMVEVRVTADREGLNAYVVSTAQREAAGVAAPMAATAAAGAKADVMRTLEKNQQTNRRVKG